MLKLVKKSRCNLILKFGSACLSLAFPALQQQRSICPQAQEGAAQLWGQEHPECWDTQAGFCPCFTFHSFHVQWKSLTKGTGAPTDTLHTAAGVGALQGFLLGGGWSCMTLAPCRTLHHLVTNRGKRLKATLLDLAMLLSPSIRISLYFHSPLRKKHILGRRQSVLIEGRVHHSHRAQWPWDVPAGPALAPGRSGWPQHCATSLETPGRDGDSL